jgi:hypothetical protein
MNLLHFNLTFAFNTLHTLHTLPDYYFDDMSNKFLSFLRKHEVARCLSSVFSLAIMFSAAIRLATSSDGKNVSLSNSRKSYLHSRLA